MTDAEIKREEFLEFINMVLSTGEVPNLLAKDDKQIWMADLTAEYIKEHKDN
jgi:dynein heavy chain